MTLEEEFEVVCEYDPAAIVDLFSATGQDQKIFYRDPLFDLYRGIDTNAKGAHELLKIFNNTSEIKLNINDIGNDTTDFLKYIKAGMSDSNRFKDYCKKAFIKAMQNVPDNSIERYYLGDVSNYAEITLGGLKLTEVPSYLKKYIKILIPSISFSNCNIKHLDMTDSIYYNNLYISNCDSLKSIKAFSCENIRVAAKACNQVEVIKRPYELGNNTMEINITETAITSLKELKMSTDPEFFYRVYLPTAITDLENPDYSDEAYIHYYLKHESQLNTFFGLKLSQMIYLTVFHSALALPDIMQDVNMMKNYLPNIKNVKDQYIGYLEILNAYPDLLTNTSLKSIYKTYKPKNVKEFELLINKVKSYDADFEKIMILVSSLLK